MWIVVYKQDYYPSVFEYENHSDALNAYDKIKKKVFRIDEDIEDSRLYIAKVQHCFGNLDRDVDWYVNYQKGG